MSSLPIYVNIAVDGIPRRLLFTLFLSRFLEFSYRVKQNIVRCWSKGLRSNLQNRNIVVDLGAVLLRDALGDPDDVAAFLLLQLQVGVEDTEVELLHECVDVQLDLERDFS